MRLRYLPILLMVALTCLWLAEGCGKSDGKVIARVGSHDITVQEFNDLTGAANRNYPSAEGEFEQKTKDLDSLINQRLLIQDAYNRGMDKSEALTSAVLANKDKFLLDVLYQREIKDKTSMSEAALKDYYDKLTNKIRVSHILVANVDTAQSIVTRLSQGASYEQLAYDYSIDPNAKRNRGDLGYLLWGGMATLPEFEDAAFKLRVGEVSPPIKTRYGYHIIKVAEVEPNEARGDFATRRAALEKSFTAAQEARTMVRYVQEIMDKYPIAVDTTTLSYLVRKQQDMYPPEVLAGLPKGDFDDQQLDRNEKELVVATWEGGPISVMDYLTNVRKLPAQMRPSLSQFDSVKAITFQIKLPDILAYEANKRGVENDDQFKQKVTLFRELTMADMLKTDSIMKAAQPTEQELRAYYDAHPEEFTDEPRVHIYEIQLSDELLARNLVRSIKSLDAFKKKAMEVNERAGRREAGGDLGYIIRRWYPEIFDAAYKTPVGDLGGPVVAAGKYSIFFVVDKVDQTVMDFLGVKQQIAGQLLSRSQEQNYANWIADRRKNTEIEVDTVALWSTIDKARYATADSSAAPAQKQ